MGAVNCPATNDATGKSNEAVSDMLVAKAARGNKEALIELCQSITKSVMFRTMRRLPDPMDAEDAAQEVLLRVCRNIHSLKEPKAFGGWLNTIINNEINRQLKKTIKRRANIIDYEEYTIAETVADDNEDNSPYEYTRKNEVKKAIISVVDKLPDRQLEAVMLHHYEGMSITEAAKAMNISKPTISRYLEIAHNKIFKQLQLVSVT